MNRIILSFFVATLVIGMVGCVSQKKFDEVNQAKLFYEQEAKFADSLRITNEELGSLKSELNAEVKALYSDLERSNVSNQSLQRAFDDITNRYNQLLEQNKSFLSSSAYEKLNLQERLAAQQVELDKKARELADIETELRRREQALANVQNNVGSLQSDLAATTSRVQELETVVKQQNQRLQTFRDRINYALRGFTSADLTVQEKGGKIYVSLSQNLLFRSGSDQVDPKGKQALAQLAVALNENTDFDIVVEGHTDSDGMPDKNWDLSVLRATAVTKILISSGVVPGRIIASGRGLHLPVAGNDTPQGKALNRRTEIILSPKLDALYSIINQK